MGQRSWQRAHQRYAKKLWYNAPHLMSSEKWKLKYNEIILHTSFFFFLPSTFFSIYYLFILLYSIVLALPYIDLNLPWVYMCSPSWTLLPPHPIPLGHPNAPAPSTLYHASNPDWQFVSNMIIYMFQCHSPISSRPCRLPQGPKDYSIHLTAQLHSSHTLVK